MALTTGVRQGGFTLLEVMVALMILALALGAVIRGTAVNAANAAYLRDKTFAHWVAMNVAAEYRLLPEWPGLGKRTGKAEMAGREWHWGAEVLETFDKQVRRVDIEVRLDDSRKSPSLARTIAFLANRQAAAGDAPGNGGGDAP